MTRSSRILLAQTLSLAASAVLLAGCGQSAAQKAPPPSIPEVGVVTVAARPISLTTELAGRTAPYLIAEVRPQVGGIVKVRRFTEGSDVKAGQTLYEIDASMYQANVSSAKAAFAKAEANLMTSRLKAERYKELAAIDAVSKQANDDAVAALHQAEADVAASRAALETANIHLGYTRVTAPVAGRIGKSNITPGALLSAGQANALATVQQLDPVYVDVTQSSAELLRLRKELAAGTLKSAGSNQAAVKLILEDGSSYAHTGKLQFSDVTVDQGTGTVTLRAVFPNPRHELLPGMYVRAVLENGVRENALLVPQQGVTRDPKGNATSLVVNAEGKVEARALQASRAIGDQWLVDAGIKAGERVIVEGVQKVGPGVAVKAVERTAPEGASGKVAAAAGSPQRK